MKVIFFHRLFFQLLRARRAWMDNTSKEMEARSPSQNLLLNLYVSYSRELWHYSHCFVRGLRRLVHLDTTSLNTDHQELATSLFPWTSSADKTSRTIQEMAVLRPSRECSRFQPHTMRLLWAFIGLNHRNPLLRSLITIRRKRMLRTLLPRSWNNRIYQNTTTRRTQDAASVWSCDTCQRWTISP